jgi:hypothetical protein
MHTMIRTGAFAVALCAALGSAHAAQDSATARAPDTESAGGGRVTETRVVDARVARIKLDGVVNLVVRQGAVPAMVIRGDKRWLDRAKIVQDGETLSIDTNYHANWNPFRSRKDAGISVELTLPTLRELHANSVGSSEIRGFRGDKLKLAQQGAGNIELVSSYRLIEATLGGVGSLDIGSANSEAIELDMQGAGSVKLQGRSKSIKVRMGGVGSLEARQCEAEFVDLDLSGVGSATVSSTQSAKLNLSGVGSATIFGSPRNRVANVSGIGSVSWR